LPAVAIAKEGLPLLPSYYLTVIVFGIITLIISFSRTAWVAFILLMLISRITNYSRNTIFHKTSVLYITGASVLLFFCVYFSLPYFQTLTATNESVFVRNELNSAALSMWWKPLPPLTPTSYLLTRFIGTGLGNFLIELPKIYPHRDIFFLQPVHNIYLLVLTETGLIGLMIFLWGIYRNLWQKKFNILQCALCIMLLIGLVDHYPLTLQQGQLLFAFFFSINLIHAR
jgi:O-antigen ligase